MRRQTPPTFSALYIVPACKFWVSRLSNIMFDDVTYIKHFAGLKVAVCVLLSFFADR